MSLDVCDAPSDVEQDVDVVVDGEQAREGAADKNVHGQAQVPHIVGAPVLSADSAPRHSGSARVMAHSRVLILSISGAAAPPNSTMTSRIPLHPTILTCKGVADVIVPTFTRPKRRRHEAKKMQANF